jgi:hypothetical protein
MLAEGVRFELTRPFGLPVFKTGAINRSATPPGALRPTVAALYERRKLWEKLAKVIRFAQGYGVINRPPTTEKLKLDGATCSCEREIWPGKSSCP